MLSFILLKILPLLNGPIIELQKYDVEFIKMIKNLVIDERISLETAKLIIDKYKSERSGN